MEYHIPLVLEPGRFVMEAETDGAELPEGFLRIQKIDGFLEYTHPVYGGAAIRVYHVPEGVTLAAEYGADCCLLQVSYLKDGETALVYAAPPQAEILLCKFIQDTEERLTERILQEKGAVSRLFFEYYGDSESPDFAVKPGTPADMEAIRQRYGADTDAVENSGDYPYENRIACDSDMFRVLLLCTWREGVFRETVQKLMENITRRVVPALNKTPDFRVVDAEYD